uniref:(northern house mosquito) hypothetical protein n=1 Tax=Culex pipiens TaxID=7175 RepID=A0A8D8CC79_CULPI
MSFQSTCPTSRNSPWKSRWPPCRTAESRPVATRTRGPPTGGCAGKASTTSAARRAVPTPNLRATASEVLTQTLGFYGGRLPGYLRRHRATRRGQQICVCSILLQLFSPVGEKNLG